MRDVRQRLARLVDARHKRWDVHLPLGLAFIIPALPIGFAGAIWTGRIRIRARKPSLRSKPYFSVTGFVAMNTGEREEDHVESIVVHSALERHEAYAEQFVWATAITLRASALVLVSQRQTSSRVCQRAISPTV